MTGIPDFKTKTLEYYPGKTLAILYHDNDEHDKQHPVLKQLSRKELHKMIVELVDDPRVLDFKYLTPEEKDELITQLNTILLTDISDEIRSCFPGKNPILQILSAVEIAAMSHQEYNAYTRIVTLFNETYWPYLAKTPQLTIPTQEMAADFCQRNQKDLAVWCIWKNAKA